jgi:two-component system alkaline phosphatase synthesis response regulator PhoP
MAHECRPHLILLDILMPVMNGYETCKRLREDPSFDHTRILFLSALSESYTRELGFQLAADGYICKPLRINALVQSVEEWLSKAG